MRRVVFAIAAHPDDIEFMMAGTLIELGKTGYELHYMTIANGSCGTATLEKDEIIRIRTQEARSAAEFIGAEYHPPITDDLEIYYERELLAKLCAIIRQVEPNILLVPSPEEYMEDHSNTCRLSVSAAFCRSLKNFPTNPPTQAINNEMAVYHAMPYGLKDPLRKPIIPDFFIDISDAIKQKREMLAMHKSQKEWLDHSQGIDSYLTTMEQMSAQVGTMSGKFEYAEGWRRHSHLGFASSEEFDPLAEALQDKICFLE